MARQRWPGALIGVLAFPLMVIMANGVKAEDRPPTPLALAQSALHLLEGARYGEAIPAVQALVGMAPEDAFGYQLRGTLDLYVGNRKAAEQDWRIAAAQGTANPVTLYGQALCGLQARRWEEAETRLQEARQESPLSSDQSADIDTALAYVHFLQGGWNGAFGASESVAAAPTDSVRAEMRALATVKANPQDGAALLTEFLKTAGGVPRVREDEGLRPLFDPSSPGIEPSVLEPSLQAMFQESLRAGASQAAGAGKSAPRVSGDLPLTAPARLGRETAAVTFSIDGQLAGLVNTPPYSYTWHTAQGGNGWHTLQIDALDASANVLSRTTRRVRVENAHPAAPSAGLSGDAALEGHVWNLLRLRPSRKVAEWALADLNQQAGDTVSAGAHRAVSAALDANYKDGRHAARMVFGGRGGGMTLAARNRLGVDDLGGLTQGHSGRRQVALTFDDGPNPQKTPALLDALDKAGAPATFFVVGARAEAAPDLVRRMAQRGDDVEDHSYTHPNMAQTAPPIAEAEILRASVVIRALTGKQPRFFRPPGGNRSPVVYRLAKDYGQTVALWSLDALHYEESAGPQGLTVFVLGHVTPGAIVLLHNGMDSTTAAIPGLVAALRAKGYQLVTLSELVHPGAAVKSASNAK